MKSNEELLQEFIEDVTVRGWSKWPIKSSGYTLNMFFEQIGKHCTEVDVNDLKKYLLYLKTRPGRLGRDKPSSSTLKKHVDNLASFYEYLEFEDYIVKSPVPKFRKRYLKQITSSNGGKNIRQLITVEQMSKLVNSALDPQEKAAICLLAKTGVRAAELLAIDMDDINWDKNSIKLKPNGKRTNLKVFFDEEAAKVLHKWIDIRDRTADSKEKALFVKSSNGKRMTLAILNRIVKRKAIQIGVHDEESSDLEKRFTPHCCRHWFTTHMRRGGMPREFIQELRGDSRGETIDIYDHIDEEELRKSYLGCVPMLGV